MMNRDRFYDRWLTHKLGLLNWSVIPNGTYPERFAAELPDFRSIYDIGDTPLILQVSNYHPLKNQEMALRAFLRLGHEDAVLAFIGNQLNDYAYRLQRLYQKAKRSHQVGRVLFLEHASEDLIYAAYAAADLFLCCSQSEAQPLVILDAMGSSTPFISTNVGCISELPGGVIVRSEMEMAHQISELLTDAARRLHLGKAGRAACISTYNWAHVIDAYEALLQRLGN
jgi:glycosyltransferase involved in cell wall biosynthesis